MFNATSRGRAWMLKNYYVSTSYFENEKHYQPDDYYFFDASKNLFEQVLKNNPPIEIESRARYMIALIEAFIGTDESYANAAKNYEKFSGSKFYKEANCSWTKKGKRYVDEWYY